MKFVYMSRNKVFSSLSKLMEYAIDKWMKNAYECGDYYHFRERWANPFAYIEFWKVVAYKLNDTHSVPEIVPLDKLKVAFNQATKRKYG